MKYRQDRLSKQQRGFALVWLALGLTAIMGMGAIGIDVSMWYARKADLQKTADNACLAGGYVLQQGGTVASAVAKANQIATLNGYSLHLPADPSNPNNDVTSDIHYPYNNHPNWFSVRVQVSEIPYFARVLGHGLQHLEASATSEYQAPVDAWIAPSDYGKTGTASNYSLFGPKALRANGDRYSPLYLDASLKVNSDHLQDGYDFSISVPANYAAKNGGNSKMQVELFDPDCVNTGNAANAAPVVKNATTGDVISGCVDEIRGGVVAETMQNTTTQYSLVYTPDDSKIAPTTIASATYSTDTATDLKWVTPPGFTIDTSLYTAGRLHVQVLSTDGSSENGFEIRAGPTHATTSVAGTGTFAGKNYDISAVNENTWYDQYSGFGTNKTVNGTKVGAHGTVPLNFNQDGAVDIALGYVPPSTVGGTFYVERFDCDLTPGGKRVLSYTCDSSTAFTVLLDPNEDPNNMGANNGVTRTDVITLLPSYPGGNWTAHYSATSQDTSTWTLHATTTGKDGYLELVGDTGKLH